MQTSPQGALPPSPRPRLAPTSLGRWLKENLFNTWYNSLLTLVSLWFVWVAISSTARWAFATARWEVIPANLTPLLIGTYPRGQVWRIWVALLTVAFLAGASAGAAGGRGKRVAAWMRSEEHTSELQSREKLVCRLLLEKQNTTSREGRRSQKAP